MLGSGGAARGSPWRYFDESPKLCLAPAAHLCCLVLAGQLLERLGGLLAGGFLSLQAGAGQGGKGARSPAWAGQVEAEW